MDETPNLHLPYIIAAQAQKHVTHNEALRALDALVQIGVQDRDLTAPPASPADGARYIVGASPSGVWTGKAGQIAAFQDNAWMFYPPRAGWLAFVADEPQLVVWDGAGWTPVSGGGGAPAMSHILNASPHGATTRFELAEQELTLAGAYIDSSLLIPARAIVFGVSTRTTQAITGATSYNCGIAGETSKYGGSLGIALGSSNAGVTGPTAFYADTPVRLSANGGAFSGGKVRIAIHYLLCSVPTS